ncbi:MAG: MFS transporter [Planctomycetes bacterium]|nr:MFS transporter [Planctomycetota bacterium]
MTVASVSPLAVLRNNSDVRKIWFAQIITETGDWLTRIAVTSFVANDRERPALATATILALMMAPYLFVSPFSGVIADRFPRRTVMMWADGIAAIAVFGYLLGFHNSVPGFSLILVGAVVVVHLGLAGVFEASRTALIAAAARPEELASANAITQTTWSVCLALGSALGGWIVQQFGRDTAVVVDSLTFQAGVAVLYTVRAGRESALRKSGADGGSFAEGIRYLRKRPRTRILLFPKLALGLVGMNDLAFALLGPRQFNISAAEATSAYFLCIGFGTLLGPPIGNALARGEPKRMRVGIGLAFVCEAAIFSGTLFSHSLYLTTAFAGVATACGSIIWTFSCTLLQRATPDHVTGRAVALDFGLLTASVSVSLIVAGLLVDYLQFMPRHLFALTTAIYAFGGVLWLLILYYYRGGVWDGDAGRPAGDR